MNALQRNIIDKKADVYKVSAAQAYGFATLLAIDDCLKAICQLNFSRIDLERVFLKCVERLVEEMEKEQCS